MLNILAASNLLTSSPLGAAQLGGPVGLRVKVVVVVGVVGCGWDGLVWCGWDCFVVGEKVDEVMGVGSGWGVTSSYLVGWGVWWCVVVVGR